MDALYFLLIVFFAAMAYALIEGLSLLGETP